MKNPRLFTYLRKSAESDKEKALMSLELLSEHPAGIGDHSTEDFYKNAEEALAALADAEDRLEMLDKHFPLNDQLLAQLQSRNGHASVSSN